jgi:DNA-binding NarL/FixJ family response regulator
MAVRCFIADDHPAIVDAISRFLANEEGITIVGNAGDGAETIAAIRELEPDVAVVDVRMPGPDGIEITRQLGAAGSRTGVILYTGYAERALAIEAIDAGALGFVLKESPLTDLVRAVRLVAEGRTFVDPVLAGVLAGPDATSRIPGLTKREREVLRLLADGMRNEQVGRELSISPLTVRSHIENAMAKLEADTRTQAVASALRMSIIE